MRVVKGESGPTVVAGAIPRSTVAEVIAETLDHVEFCLTKGLNDGSHAEGEISLSWEITPEGRAFDIRMEDTASELQWAAPCLRGRIRLWRFPEAEGRTQVQQRWSFRIVEVQALEKPKSHCLHIRQGDCRLARKLLESGEIGPEVLDDEWVEEGRGKIVTDCPGLLWTCRVGGGDYVRRLELQGDLLACGEIRAGAMQVKGSLSRDFDRPIRDAVVHRCYLRELVKDWSSSGKIEIGWSVDADGQHSNPRVISYERNLERVADCVLDAIKAGRFGRPNGPADVVQAWTLRPAKLREHGRVYP